MYIKQWREKSKGGKEADVQETQKHKKIENTTKLYVNPDISEI